MPPHTRHFWTHLVVLCSFEQEGGTAVHRGQILSSKLGILWIYVASRQLGIWGKTRSNHDYVSDLQVVVLRKRPEFLTYNSELDDRLKLIFTVGAWFFRVPSCLELAVVRFSQFQVKLF
jgi:hypothetical protein